MSTEHASSNFHPPDWARGRVVRPVSPLCAWPVKTMSQSYSAQFCAQLTSNGMFAYLVVLNKCKISSARPAPSSVETSVSTVRPDPRSVASSVETSVSMAKVSMISPSQQNQRVKMRPPPRRLVYLPLNLSQRCHKRVPPLRSLWCLRVPQRMVTYDSSHTDPIVVRFDNMSLWVADAGSETTLSSPSMSHHSRKRKKDKKK